MRLAELEVVQVVGLHERDAHGVEGSEQPAAAGAALVGDGLHLVNLRRK